MVRFLVVYETPSDPAGFDLHYQQVHIPLGKKLPGLRRYTISRNAAAVRGGEPFYLVAELDWDDMARSADGVLSRLRDKPRRVMCAELAPDGRVRSMIFEVEDV